MERTIPIEMPKPILLNLPPGMRTGARSGWADASDAIEAGSRRWKIRKDARGAFAQGYRAGWQLAHEVRPTLTARY